MAANSRDLDQRGAPGALSLKGGALNYSTRVEDAREGRGEDRIATLRLLDRTIFVVADGAGGVAGGAAAAEAICQAAAEQLASNKPADWSDWLAHLDREIARSKGSGLAAAIVIEIADDGSLAGASVGDCEAWAFVNGVPTSLTAGQVRKPLLGEGAATPVGFQGHLDGGTLLVATDGLWKYMDRARIAKTASTRPLEQATAALVDGLRLKSGALQDDVALVICEVARR